MLQKKEIFALLLKKIDVALSSFYEAARNIFWAQFRHSLSFFLYSLIQKNAANQLIAAFLRRKGDSNPRYGYPYDSLANCWFKPLTHLSL